MYMYFYVIILLTDPECFDLISSIDNRSLWQNVAKKYVEEMKKYFDVFGALQGVSHVNNIINGNLPHVKGFKSHITIVSQPSNAGINFIPRDTTQRGKNLPPRDNHFVHKPSPQDKTWSQKPHHRDIKLENFTNVSINSDTIWNEKLCGLNK